MHIALLNTSIITADGSFTYRTISLVAAREIVGNGANAVSHIGHESTAAIMTELLGFPIAMSRVPFSHARWQIALVFKLNGRPPEGRILSREEIDSIGYAWGVMQRTE
jgi:hypothetical protein